MTIGSCLAKDSNMTNSIVVLAVDKRVSGITFAIEGHFTEGTKEIVGDKKDLAVSGVEGIATGDSQQILALEIYKLWSLMRSKAGMVKIKDETFWVSDIGIGTCF